MNTARLLLFDVQIHLIMPHAGEGDLPGTWDWEGILGEEFQSLDMCRLRDYCTCCCRFGACVDEVEHDPNWDHNDHRLRAWEIRFTLDNQKGASAHAAMCWNWPELLKREIISSRMATQPREGKVITSSEVKNEG